MAKLIKMVMRSINRNIVECKGSLNSAMQILTLCINRNIVEYKDFLKNGGCYMGKSINRNIVECKAHKQHFTVYFCIVIIETLWNVKKF